MTINPEYLGRRLLERGFDNWFLYMFQAIEGHAFIVEPIHRGLFDYMNKLYKGEVTRLNINIPPRAGKTTMAKYLLVYALTVNPKANIIYTSFSQSLLTDIATSVHNILEHPIYKSMYPTNTIIHIPTVQARIRAIVFRMKNLQVAKKELFFLLLGSFKRNTSVF